MQGKQLFVSPHASKSLRRAIAISQRRARGARKGAERLGLVLAFMLMYAFAVWLFYGFSAELPLSRQLVALATAGATVLLVAPTPGMLVTQVVNTKLAHALARRDILLFDSEIFARWNLRLRVAGQSHHVDDSLAWLEAKKYDELCALYEQSRIAGWEPRDAEGWYNAMFQEYLSTLAPNAEPYKREPEQTNGATHAV